MNDQRAWPWYDLDKKKLFHLNSNRNMFEYEDGERLDLSGIDRIATWHHNIFDGKAAQQELIAALARAATQNLCQPTLKRSQSFQSTLADTSSRYDSALSYTTHSTEEMKEAFTALALGPHASRSSLDVDESFVWHGRPARFNTDLGNSERSAELRQKTHRARSTAWSVFKALIDPRRRTYSLARSIAAGKEPVPGKHPIGSEPRSSSNDSVLLNFSNATEFAPDSSVNDAESSVPRIIHSPYHLSLESLVPSFDAATIAGIATVPSQSASPREHVLHSSEGNTPGSSADSFDGGQGPHNKTMNSDSASDYSCCSQCTQDETDLPSDKELFIRIYTAAFTQWIKYRFTNTRFPSHGRSLKPIDQHLEGMHMAKRSINDTAQASGSNKNTAANDGLTDSSSAAVTDPPPNGSNTRTGSRRQKRRGPIQDEDDDKESDEDQAPKRTKTRTDGDTEHGADELACPYYKRRPGRYSTQKTCLKGWKTVHRLKCDHLYKHHMLPIRCVRCGDVFKNQSKLDAHLVTNPPCVIRAFLRGEGIDSDLLTKLKKRRQDPEVGNHKFKTLQTLEDEKWRQMFRIIFPDEDEADIPSPYIGSPNRCTHDHEENLGTFMQFDFLHELRRAMSIAIDRGELIMDRSQNDLVLQLANGIIQTRMQQSSINNTLVPSSNITVHGPNVQPATIGGATGPSYSARFGNSFVDEQRSQSPWVHYSAGLSTNDTEAWFDLAAAGEDPAHRENLTDDFLLTQNNTVNDSVTMGFTLSGETSSNWRPPFTQPQLDNWFYNTFQQVNNSSFRSGADRSSQQGDHPSSQHGKRPFS